MSSRIEAVMRDYRLRLLSRDAQLQTEYTRRWLRVEDALKGTADALALEIRALRDSGDSVPEWKIYQMERYQALIEQAQREVDRFNRYAAGLIEKEQYLAWADGIDYGRDTIGALWKGAGLEVRTFPVLDVERVRSMIGLAADGSPLAQLLARAYPGAVESLTQNLVDALAQGWNPRKTARVMLDAMSGNLQHALLVSRAEQMRAHRTATVQQYRESNVVVRYHRRAALSARTCLACLLEDGKMYELEHQFSDHPSGRCTCTPVLVDLGEPEMQSGHDWLLGLEPGGQEAIMGTARYQAWKAGEISLGDMSRMHDHPIWGENPQVVPWRELRDRGGVHAER